HSKNKNITLPEKQSTKEKLSITFKNIPALLLIIIIIGGITVGYYTATEAAVIAVLYTLVISFLFYRTLKIKELSKVFYKTSQSVSNILFTIASASIFGWLLAYLNGATIISEWFSSVSTNPYILLLLIALLLLFLGTFMSEIATIIIFTPVFIQVQQIGGIDPVHMGVIVVMTLCLGLVTPPLGICLLIASQISQIRFTSAIKTVIPLILIFLAVVILLIFVPKLVLFIPDLLA